MTRDFGGGRNVVMPMRWKRSPPTAAIILPTCWSCWNGEKSPAAASFCARMPRC